MLNVLRLLRFMRRIEKRKEIYSGNEFLRWGRRFLGFYKGSDVKDLETCDRFSLPAHTFKHFEVLPEGLGHNSKLRFGRDPASLTFVSQTKSSGFRVLTV
jgi:hypothetical protein